MSAEFGMVAASEGIGRVEQIGDVGYLQGENWHLKVTMYSWDVTDVQVQHVVPVTGVRANGADDSVDSWVDASETDSPRSMTITPPTGKIELRGNASAKATSRGNLTVTSSARPVRLGQPVSLAQQVRLARPPATRLVSGLKRLLTPTAFSRIVEPLVAQEQHEYFEAIRCADEGFAVWIEARMHVLIVCNALRAVLVPIAKMFRSAN